MAIFRELHNEYAQTYIAAKVGDQIGTGGTPYGPWLQQLVNETREAKVAV